MQFCICTFLSIGTIALSRFSQESVTQLETSPSFLDCHGFARWIQPTYGNVFNFQRKFKEKLRHLNRQVSRCSARSHITITTFIALVLVPETEEYMRHSQEECSDQRKSGTVY